MTRPISAEERIDDLPDQGLVNAIIDSAARAQQIQAIHDLATFYAEHPNEPMPEHIIAIRQSFGGFPNGLPEHDRVIAVLDFATRNGLTPTESWDKVQARLELSDTSGMSIVISSTAHLLKPKMPPRYVK